MKKVFFITSFLFLCINGGVAQTTYRIQGHLPQNINTELGLSGYTGRGDTLIASTKTDDKGRFTMRYPASYRGAAVLEIKPNKSVILLLDGENFEMQWDNLEELSSLNFTHSRANDTFAKGLELYQKTELKRAGLTYLIPLYNQDSTVKLFLQKELELENKAMHAFINSLSKDSYASYYIKLRKLLSDMQQPANRSTEQILDYEKEFNSVDFSNANLIQSGLLTNLVEGYFIVLESYGDKQYQHMNASIDAIIKSLQSEPVLLKQITGHLFTLLEKRSLFPAAEHVALSMLSSSSCQLDGKHEALFEQYRKMAKGKKAPELQFENTKSTYTKLSDIKNKYKLVVFGSSWCPKCAEEMLKLKNVYDKWKKEKDLEVIFVSLDNEKEKYENFTKDFLWISSCDLKGWEGKAARDFYIFATPTVYLLDANNRILLKPISIEQIQAWFEMAND